MTCRGGEFGGWYAVTGRGPAAVVSVSNGADGAPGPDAGRNSEEAE